ncbi:MAG: hypothetical protein ACOY3P_20110 [Planctomycetota bacterium]
MHDANLPFPRGQTWSYFGKAGVTVPDTDANQLMGQLFTVDDTIHDSGKDVTLRLVRNDSGAAITVARRCCGFAGVDAEEYGGAVDGYVGAAGEVGKPIDDAYPVGTVIPANDYFYVVDAGPCKVKTSASTVNLAVHSAVTVDASGYVGGSKPTVDQAVLGVIDAASTDEATEVLIYVEPGLRPGYGT